MSCTTMYEHYYCSIICLKHGIYVWVPTIFAYTPAAKEVASKSFHNVASMNPGFDKLPY